MADEGMASAFWCSRKYTTVIGGTNMTDFMHNLIKLNLIKSGYLPNLPPHLISIEEMCDGFLTKTDDVVSGYFADTYPCLSPNLTAEYNELVDCILGYTDTFKSKGSVLEYLPDWIYSYMIGAVVGPDSNELDRHDMFVLMGMDNMDDEYTPEIAETCYRISKQWLSRNKSVGESPDRVPTMFGEPHVLKYLRLNSLGVS